MVKPTPEKPAESSDSRKSYKGISGGGTLTPPQIQAAAARFANEEPQKEGIPSELLMQYPSPSSVSDGVVQADSDMTIDWSFLDLLTTGDSVSDFGVFSGIDDFPGEFFPPPPPIVDYGEENIGGDFPQQSFLWNF
ncbi:hypothetical protein HHK36_014426 [Tetracentron sinense]|uniref:Uncharacterized protein n=1 Tax=Tetracentron sinense TaxID=13715 RepID=A0A834ZER8_TETSI|nr:hypothetical protein HHK36_014426 [Tetracentron sinense]